MSLVLDSLATIADRIDGGDLPEAILAPYRAQFDAHEAAVHAYLEPRYAKPLTNGGAGSLASAPFALKDNFALEGTQCTCASRILEGFRPAYTATVVQRLLDAGAQCVGKTNLDEFAMGSSTEHGAFGVTKNPFDTTRTAGGSSGGSAVAVAAGMAAFSLGSDTGGSVRQPAAFTGLVGFKPSYGRLSRYGLVAFASSLDHPSTFTRSVQDAARVYSVMAGPDPRDATTLPAADAIDVSIWQRQDLRGLKIGVFRQAEETSGIDVPVRAAYERTRDLMASAGAEIIALDCPLLEQAVGIYYILAPAEASSNLARYDGIRFGPTAPGTAHPNMTAYYADVRTRGFGPEVTRRILLGTFVLSAGYFEAYYGKAGQVRALLQRQFATYFEQVDAILTPTTPTLPFALGAKLNDPVAMYLNDLFTIPANLTGVPAMSLPVGWSDDGLPIGMHLMTGRLDESRLFEIGHWLEGHCGFVPRLP